MKRLAGYLRRHRSQYLYGALCLFLTATVQMSIPWLIKSSVEAISARAPSSTLSTYVLAIIGLAVFLGVIRSFSRFLIFNAGRNVESDLRDDLFTHLQRLGRNFYLSHRTGDLMSRLVNDLNTVRMLVSTGTLNLINAPLYYAYAIPLMFAIDPRLTLFTILPYLSILWLVKTYRARIKQMSTQVQQAMGSISSRVHESVAGRELVKNFVLEKMQTEEFLEVNDRYKERSVALARTRGLMHQVIRGVTGLAGLMVIWYGGSRVAAGDLTIADLIAFLAYLYILSGPNSVLGRVWSLVIRARASMDRLEEILSARPEITGPSHPERNGRDLHGTLEFKNVSFAYASSSNGRAALKDVSFTVRKGTTVGVVGRIGSGKTTLVSLIPRIHDVTQGQILLDGRDIREIPLRELRRKIGLIPQDPFLFSDTLRRNITFGLESSQGDGIARAASLARLEDDVKDFPMGYDTVVGERGVTLSGGQRQRAAIARALILDPAILILDDALSSVDGPTEQEILDGLSPLLHDRTSIIITHRVSVLRHADEILVLDDGRIVERGSHPSLLAKGGVYTELFKQQEISEELERY